MDVASFYFGRWNTNPDLAFASVGPNSRLPDRRVLDKFLMRLTRTSITPLTRQPKRLSHAVIEITIFRVGMRSVNLSIKFSCSLLRKTTPVWLLQLCLPSLTECGGIDGSRQLGASTFHTLVEKRGVL